MMKKMNAFSMQSTFLEVFKGNTVEQPVGKQCECHITSITKRVPAPPDGSIFYKFLEGMPDNF